MPMVNLGKEFSQIAPPTSRHSVPPVGDVQIYKRICHSLFDRLCSIEDCVPVCLLCHIVTTQLGLYTVQHAIAGGVLYSVQHAIAGCVLCSV